MIDYTKLSIEELENNAFMIMLNIAFFFNKNETDKFIVAVNLKDSSQVSTFKETRDSIEFMEGCMNREDLYFTLYVVEKNKQRLLKGLQEWENTQVVK